MDLTPITTPLIETAGAIVAIVVPILAARVITLAEKRLNFSLTAQQQATLTAAEGTAVGLVQAELAKGEMKLSDVNVSSPTVQASVTYLNNTVPKALAFFQLTPDIMAQKIVGKVGAALAADPTVLTVATVPATTPGAAA